MIIIVNVGQCIVSLLLAHIVAGIGFYVMSKVDKDIGFVISMLSIFVALIPVFMDGYKDNDHDTGHGGYG